MSKKNGRPWKKLHPMAKTDHTKTSGHGDSMTKSAMWGQFSENLFFCQGSTKWSSWLSKITETPISHGNVFLEIRYKMRQKRYFWQNKLLPLKLRQKQISVQVSVRDTYFYWRRKNLSERISLSFCQNLDWASITQSKLQVQNIPICFCFNTF